MNEEAKRLLGAMVFCLVLITFIVTTLKYNVVASKRDMVKRGLARYEMNPATGAVDFKWIDRTDCTDLDRKHDADGHSTTDKD